MASTLPPLDDLRAFDAAARHGSFARAAGELHVTPAAVSHRIRHLEQALATELFRRRPRAVELTAAGRRYHDEVADALRQIERATAGIGTPGVDGPLCVSMPHSFLDRWLIGRLPEFTKRFPGLALTLDGDSSLRDLRAGHADLGLRFGSGDYAGLDCERLCGDAVAPLGLRSVVGSSFDPVALLRAQPLLEDSRLLPGEPWNGWGPWLREAGIDDARALRYLRLSDSGSAARLCLAGGGLCVGRLSLVADDVARGELVALMPWRSTEFSWFLVSRPADAANPRLATFRDWLRAELAGFAAAAATLTGVRLRAGTP